MVGSSNAPNWSDALYRGLGLMAVVTMWLWLLTPLELIYSGMPLALSWSVLVGWSVIRLVTRFASTKRVTEALLMGATAGYLHIGLAAGLVMSALETIQPGSFQPLAMANVGDSSVLASARLFFGNQLRLLRLPHHRRLRGHQPEAPPVTDGECGHQRRRTALPRCRDGGADRPLRQQPRSAKPGALSSAAAAPTQQPVFANGIALMPLPQQHLIHGAEVQISKGGAGSHTSHQLRSHHRCNLLHAALPNRRGC